LNQTEIYKKASKSITDIKVILCYTKREVAKVKKILKSIKQEGAENIVIIDASPKVSASKV
jgi:ATP-dependent RNA circularization protein (DNA/RNA ligase family)